MESRVIVGGKQEEKILLLHPGERKRHEEETFCADEAMKTEMGERRRK